MAVVLIEGWDHYTPGNSEYKFWNGTIFAQKPGRIQGYSIEVIPNNPIEKQLPGSYGTVVVGCAILIPSEPNPPPQVFLALFASGVQVARLGMDVNQKLQLLDHVDTQVAIGTTIVPLDSWFYVELKLVVGSSGTGEVHLNGVTEIASSVGNFGGSDINQIAFENEALVDDVYVLDDTGGSPTDDFLGDVYVKTLYPRADGHYTDWTPDTGTTHWPRVSETLIDGDASYVHDANAGDIDTYVMETLGAFTTIYSVQLNIGARKGDAGVRQLAPLVRQSGTDYVGSTSTLSTPYLFYSEILDEDPGGSPWTPGTFNADEFGMKLIP